MDPIANIAEQIDLAKLIQALGDEPDFSRAAVGLRDQEIICHAERLAELIIALAEWNAKKGR